jgi:hypothetical protein
MLLDSVCQNLSFDDLGQGLRLLQLLQQLFRLRSGEPVKRSHQATSS